MFKEIYNELRVLLKQVTPTQAIVGELAEAEMALLRAETGVEYAQALVTYNKNRVKRLKAYMAASTTATEEVKETA
jgi:hypothetical protein